MRRPAARQAGGRAARRASGPRRWENQSVQPACLPLVDCRRRSRGLALLAALSAAATLAAVRSADAVPGYDGVWSVVIITKEGICDTSYRYPIRITNGTLGNAGTATVSITGKVGKNGAVVVNV